MPHCLLTSLCCHSAWWLSARVWRLNSLSWMDLGTLPASVYTRLSALKYSDGDVKYLFEDSAMPGRIPRSLPSTCTYTHTCIPLFLCCQSRSWRMRLWRKDVGGLFLWVEGIIWAEWNNKKKNNQNRFCTINAYFVSGNNSLANVPASFIHQKDKQTNIQTSLLFLKMALVLFHKSVLCS